MPELNPTRTYQPESIEPRVMLISDIRATIPDVFVPSEPESQEEDEIENTFFTDVEILGFYRRENNRIKRAAAAALEQIAKSDAMILKMTQILDIKTDGLSPARVILGMAKEMRNQDKEDDLESGGIEIIDYYPPGYYTT